MISRRRIRPVTGHTLSKLIRITGKLSRMFSGTAELVPDRVPSGGRETYQIRESSVYDGVAFVRIGCAAHSLWRSVELNMWHLMRPFLQAPVLDLGCGDGSFSFLLFHSIDAGVDLDENLISSAGAAGTYRQTRVADVSQHIPFEDDCFGTVVSNSVLEHVPNVEGVLREVRRVLTTGGYFVFAVPTDRFHTHLARVYGDSEAEQFNRDLEHVNLYSDSDWQQMLERFAFRLLASKRYLAPEAIAWYRLLTWGLMRRLESSPLTSAWYRVLRRKLVTLTEASIDIPEGGCTIFACRKEAY